MSLGDIGNLLQAFTHALEILPQKAQEVFLIFAGQKPARLHLTCGEKKLASSCWSPPSDMSIKQITNTSAFEQGPCQVMAFQKQQS